MLQILMKRFTMLILLGFIVSGGVCLAKKPQKYAIREDIRKYVWISVPMKEGILNIANGLMPVIQPGKKLDKSLERRKVELPNCTATLIVPREVDSPPLLVYFFGGGFVLKPGSFQKNLVQTYALEANCAVLYVDYRLAPKHPFPAAVNDCYDAYLWALEQDGFSSILLGGDSAGGNLALAVAQKLQSDGLELPQAMMLIYPVVDSRMETESMKLYTDTPLWNSVKNANMYEMYVCEEDLHNPLVSPMEADDLSFLPPTYIETAEFDCLRDEGLALAMRLTEEGVDVTLNETSGTVHGYEIAEKSSYVKNQVQKRVKFLKDAISIKTK